MRPVAVRPGHLAVLVRTNREASLVRDALAEVGVPAVINGAGSVFGTRAADDWLRLLRAIERPASATLAASAALTVFLGWAPARLAEVGDADLEELHAQLHRLGGVLRRRGVAALLETVAARTGLAARVLAERGGERTMTDLRHVGQLLHEAASEGQLGVSALAAWLSERIAQAGEDTAHEDRSRRLESDAEAVQVLTIHRSKGLEFPIVYCPFLWDPSYLTRQKEAIPVFHDPDADDERTLDVGGPDDAGFAVRYRLNADEQRGEDLRLAYVALTRARHQAVVWWAGSSASRDSSLGRLLFSTDADGNVATAGASTPSDDEVWNAVAALAPSRVSVEWTSEPPGVRWSPPAGAPTALAAARLGREIDAVWRRSSYSSVIAGTEEDRVASEPELVVEEDPADAEAVMAAGEEDPARLRAVALPLADLPSGVEIGSARALRPRARRLRRAGPPGRADAPHRRASGLARRRDRLPGGRSGGPPQRHRDPPRSRRPPARPRPRGPHRRDGLRAAPRGRRRADRNAPSRRHRRPPRGVASAPATRSPPTRSASASRA